MKKHTSVSVQFTHDSSPATFEAKYNKLSGDWLHTFNDWRTAYVSDLAEVKRTIKRIQVNDTNAVVAWQA